MNPNLLQASSRNASIWPRLDATDRWHRERNLLRIACRLGIIVTICLCAGAAEPQYQGKTLAQWVEQTRPPAKLAARRQAIGALGVFARERMGWFAPPEKSAEAPWVAREIVPVLTDLLHDDTAEVRADAANAFRNLRMAGKEAIPALTSLLSDKNELVRQRAANALESMGPGAEGSVPVLVKVAREDGSPRIRRFAAEALVHIGPSGRNAVRAMLEDKSAEIRLPAVGALEFDAVHAHESWPQLIELLKDDDSRIRAIAVTALALCHPPGNDAVSAIARVLHDDDVRVRRNAVAGLQEMQNRREDLAPALPDLLRLAEDKDEYVREYLAATLGATGQKTIIAIRALANDKNKREVETGRQHLIITALVNLLKDQNPRVRAQACDSLGEIGPAANDATAALKPLLSDMAEVEGHVCNHAGDALFKITGDKKFLEGLPPIPRDGL